MRQHCPRCEAPLPAMDKECPACGYLWRRTCPTCGSQSIPQAAFCGGCGRGFAWHDRVRLKWRKLVSYATERRLHGLGSGLAFGTLLAIFAFGTMGMSTFKPVQPVWEKADSIAAPEDVGRRILSTWNRQGAEVDAERPVTKDDLVRLGNILLEACSHALPADQPSLHVQLAGSERYLQEFARADDEAVSPEIKRSDAVVFLFRIMNDLFELSPAEDASYKYTDIPHYHYLNLPVETLESMGLRLSRNEAEFGGDDQVSLAWLSQVTKNLVKVVDRRMKDKLQGAQEVLR